MLNKFKLKSNCSTFRDFYKVATKLHGFHKPIIIPCPFNASASLYVNAKGIKQTVENQMSTHQ